MTVEEYVNYLKNKFGYSDELSSFLLKAIPALITYFGEDKKNLIFATLSECEIHVQKQGENMKDYLNGYFGVNKEWNFPILAGAFQQKELYPNKEGVKSKSIIYMMTYDFAGKYTPFDINKDATMSTLIHEICHAIKGFGKARMEDKKAVDSTGLSSTYYQLDETTGLFEQTGESVVGFEEALNSLDEANVMTIMTGTPHEYGAYRAMTSAARRIMQNEKLAKMIRLSQFTGGTEWIDFLGKEQSDVLITSFDDWVYGIYGKRDKEQVNAAQDNLLLFLDTYSESDQLDSTGRTL